MTSRVSPAWGLCMGWMLRLVETGTRRPGTGCQRAGDQSAQPWRRFCQVGAASRVMAGFRAWNPVQNRIVAFASRERSSSMPLGVSYREHPRVVQEFGPARRQKDQLFRRGVAPEKPDMVVVCN